jgi:pimeloyl-ACP methyl ester carboxylesterase
MLPGMRDGYAELGEVRLHYVEAGEGPLVVLLHGFPEFWFGWRRQLDGLAARGFRVVAPDLRGYNLSGKPDGVAAYAMERVAGDVRELIHERGEPRACVAGHDWGGATAWTLAMEHPDAVERLAILNSPHPGQFLHALRSPRQLAKSWYMLAVQPPWLPERLLRIDRWRALRAGFEQDARPGAFTPADIARYVEAWERPGAVSAMLAYYRAPARQPPRRTLARVRPIELPVRVIWGERDRYLTPEFAEPPRSDVPGLERVIRLDASHWVQHDEPERVNELLAEFFTAGG